MKSNNNNDNNYNKNINNKRKVHHFTVIIKSKLKASPAHYASRIQTKLVHTSNLAIFQIIDQHFASHLFLEVYLNRVIAVCWCMYIFANFFSYTIHIFMHCQRKTTK